MDLLTLLLLLAVGAGAGFLSRHVGPPGGLLIVPLLIPLLQSSGISSLVATQLALGTTLLAAACVLAVTALRSKEPLAQISPALLAGALPGVVGGAVAACAMRGSTVQRIFALVAVAGVLQLIGEMKRGKKELPAMGVRLFVAGLVSGVAASWSGSGGEMLCQRTLYSYLGVPLQKSRSISAAVMAAAAIAGTATFAVVGWKENVPPGSLGYVAVMHALPLIAGFLVAESATAGYPERWVPTLRRISAVILLLIAAKMFFA